MHICGFDFDAVNMEDDSFFLEDRFSTFDRDLQNKKIMVPMNPEGGTRTAPRAPRLMRKLSKNHFKPYSFMHYEAQETPLKPWSQPFRSHTRTVVRECCRPKDDDDSLWGMAKFDHPPPESP